MEMATGDPWFVPGVTPDWYDVLSSKWIPR